MKTIETTRADQTEKLAAHQELWREKYVYPLALMFSNTGVFFTLNIFSMNEQLEDRATRRQEPLGSMREMMAKHVSREASDLYYAMLKNPFPYSLEDKF